MSIENIQRYLELSEFDEAHKLILLLEKPLKVVWMGWYILHTEGLLAAEQYCLHKLPMFSNNNGLWALLGWLYWEQEQPFKGLSAYEKSLSLEWSIPAYLNAVSIACEVGNFKAVTDLIAHYEDKLDVNTLSEHDIGNYFLSKAIVARETGRPTEAMQLLNSIRFQVPEIYILRGHIYRDEFLYTQSMMAYQEGLDYFPMHPVLLDSFQHILHYLPSVPKGVHAFLADQPNSVAAFMKVRAYLERIQADLLERDKKSPEVQHLSAAIHGKNPPKPPAGYVEELFDDYAERFESHLIEKLQYQVPKLIESVVFNRFSTENLASSIWDLGCGTGLLGPPLKSVTKRLVGVDLSVKMLERAEAKKCYDDLFHQDITTFLSSNMESESPDLIIVADTLVYIGDLRPFFTMVTGCMQKETQLICTVEKLTESTEEGFQLMPTGRYSHSIDWIEWLLPQYGLTLQKKGEVVLRQGGGTWVHGWLLIIESLEE